MSINVVFDHLDRNRVFIDSRRDCTGGCLYCYVSDYDLDSLPSVTKSSGAQVAELLESAPSFTPGRYGTAISLGCYADPLHPSCVRKTENVLTHVMPFGNPIQMASKCFTGGVAMARRIAAHQQYPGQLTLLVSITTFKRARRLEPNAPPPQHRLQVLRVFRQAKINTALFIKPILVGITDHEVETFEATIKEFQIDRCVVGIFYANSRIIANLERQGLWTDELRGSTQGKRHFPNDARQTLVQFGNGDLLDRFVERLRRCTNTLVFKTSMCVVAHSLGIPDPMRTWRRYPDLCVRCQDCEGLVTALPIDLQSRYGGSCYGSPTI